MKSSRVGHRSFLGAAIGTLIEYYDNGLYIFFLPIISPVLFPSSTPYQALVNGYIILFLSLILRPIGGIFFGYFGDFYGRKSALVMSMTGIAVATTAIGLTPSYASIGIGSMIAVTCAKSFQNFCFAGEYNGAGIYVVEHAKAKNECLTSSLLTAVMLGGSLLAAIFGVILTAPGMPVWSWRLAFIAGGVMGMLGLLFRANMVEPPNFQPATQQQPLRNLFKFFRTEFIAGIFIGGLSTVPYTTAITFIAPVLMTKGLLSAQQFMILQCFLAFFAMIALIIAGKVADRFSAATTMISACCIFIVLSVPLLNEVDHYQRYSVLAVLVCLIMMNELFLGPVHAYLSKIFPMQYRYRATSLSYNIGMSLFGGLTPLIEHYLYRTTGRFVAISIWIAIISLAALLSILKVEKVLKVKSLASSLET